MHFFVLFFGCALFSTALTLRCFECTPNANGTPCTDKVTDCVGDSQCGAMRITAFMGDKKVSDMTMKSCAVPGQYINGSVNLGVTRTRIRNKYCTTDLCNMNTSDSSIRSPNGKKCFTCQQDCKATLDCMGDEDYCVSALIGVMGKTILMKGCASEIICSGGSTGVIQSTDLNCCQGNLCNNAQSSSSSVLLLQVASVLSVALLN